MPAMNSFSDHVKHIWLRLGSMSLAIILLVVLSIASVIGTVLLQNQQQADYLQQFGPLWYWTFRALGLFDMYHSWWFLTLLGFLMVSLAACLWRNVPRMLKEMKGRRAHLPERVMRRFRLHRQWQCADPEQERQRFKSALRGWEFSESEEGTTTSIRADKGRYNKWGYILVHAALLIILIGGWVSVQFGFRGDMIVPEGSSENEISFLKGTSREYMKMPFEVRCNSFTIDFFPTGAPKEFRSNLTIIDHGKEVLTKDIIVNEPLYYKGVRIYQASFGDGGSTIRFKLFHLDDFQQVEQVTTHVYDTWKDEKTGVSIEVTDFKPFNVENMAEPGKPKDFRDLGPAVEYIVRGPGLKPVKVKAFMNPFVDANGVNQGSFLMISLTGDAKDYKPFALGIDLSNAKEWQLLHAFLQHLSRNKAKDKKQRNLQAFRAALHDVYGDTPPKNIQQIAMRTLHAATTLPRLPWPYLPMLEDYDQVYYTGLQLARDPGMNIVWFGSALLVFGMCIMFYMPHRKLWLVLKRENNTTVAHLLGMSNRNEMAFAKTFNDVFINVSSAFAEHKDPTTKEKI
ncbi:MAG: cytochrome c biogenesis protein ResB [Zetaproteobacteria bacterium]|nr:MAG: cytochrome c biogenesis protein ResB [Zetaproteobacteria bacterium]